ncbi:hypothetical protein GOARA_050_00750 [Gordonia araii NBRC 100433]|uniref:Uncharacterized protein n=1 Tax=Gordonia araii NBRC 100433 TaxID=1073574 RepID=G7H2D7_9ACTN|nr:hypothetical protein GOARA_050_00750 [Gordonia araii NBRC 100433]
MKRVALVAVPLALVCVLVAASIALFSGRSGEESSRASNTIAGDEERMLTIADFPPGYSSVPLADPYVPIAKSLDVEKSTPSSPDGCHQIRVGAFEEMLKVLLSAKNFFPRPGAGQSVYTQMVFHDSNAVARQVTSGDICANSWSKNSRGQTVERRMTDLPVPQGLPAGVRIRQVMARMGAGLESFGVSHRSVCLGRGYGHALGDRPSGRNRQGAV